MCRSIGHKYRGLWDITPKQFVDLCNIDSIDGCWVNAKIVTLKKMKHLVGPGPLINDNCKKKQIDLLFLLLFYNFILAPTLQ